MAKKQIRQLAGAGGDWIVVDERQDPSVIAQLGPTHCCAACVEMILRDRGITLSQQEIAARVGVPTWPDLLPELLNEFDPDPSWKQGFVPMGLDYLRSHTPWIALFKDFGNQLLHAVIVDGFEGSHLRIRDPWPPGTTYLMKFDDFQTDHHGWTGIAIFRD